MSVGKHFFSKTAHRIFLKFLVKLGWLKGKKLTELDFWEKSYFGDNDQKCFLFFFGICKKKIDH